MVASAPAGEWKNNVTSSQRTEIVDGTEFRWTRDAAVA